MHDEVSVPCWFPFLRHKLGSLWDAVIRSPLGGAQSIQLLRLAGGVEAATEPAHWP